MRKSMAGRMMVETCKLNILFIIRSSIAIENKQSYFIIYFLF